MSEGIVNSKTIFEKSVKGRGAVTLPDCGLGLSDVGKYISNKFLRTAELKLPELSKLDIVRHYTDLSRKNFGVDNGFYPLGSCTMKYNPKINEDVANDDSFKFRHPYQSESTIQGVLKVCYLLEKWLCEVSSMSAVSLQPAAGAHGEMISLLIAKKYFETKNENRKFVLIPDSAHGTNPSSSNMSHFQAKQIKSNIKGLINVDQLADSLTDEVAVVMITNPNTLGLFEEDIKMIADMVHKKGGLIYMDGANFNAIMCKTRPGDFGVDLMHFNLHKTFSTPHGGGGPGAGPIGVSKNLIPFLPVPIIEKVNNKYQLNYDKPDSIGKIRSFYCNFPVIVKAFCYILTLGEEGLRKISENAVLNANYLRVLLEQVFEIPYDSKCMHEFVISLKEQKEKGVRCLDFAKRLIDYGVHPPTIYFPLIVQEAMMIEPTESESKETLDNFASIMFKINEEIEKNKDIVLDAPHTTPVKRLDEVQAARNPILKQTL